MKYIELNALKGLLREKKITYRELSKKTGISLNALFCKINGKSLFNTDEIIKVCNATGIEGDDVVKYFFPRMLRNVIRKE